MAIVTTTTVSKLVRAAPEDVFSQLADGWIFPVWVVGASHMRDVADDWPAPGAELHHKVGVWPLMIDDTTKVLEMTPNRRLVLQARAKAFGQARVEITIEPEGADSVVTMSETPTDGPGRWLNNPLQRLILRRRNIECLDRLATLAEKRVNGTAGDAGQRRSR